MRRVLLLIAGVLALALAAPSAALAHHGHHGHHGRHHHHHHHKVKHTRVRHFGAEAGTTTPAGTVAAFDGTVLRLTLADGSTVSGKVTDDTQIGCVPAVQTPTPGPTAATAHDGGWGDDGDDDGWDDHGGWGEHHGDCDGPSACTTADLVPGAVVHEAILKLGSDGAEFKLVLLVKQEQQES